MHRMSPAILLRKRLRARNLECLSHHWRSRIRLTSADRYGICAFRNDRVARSAHYTQVAIRQHEANLLRLTGLQVNALKAAQSPQGCSGHIWEAEVELSNFVALVLSGICDPHRGDKRISRADR